MRIVWLRCESYKAARDFWGIIYVHECDGKPFYWGKAHKSFFGGHMRTRDGLTASGRYNAGYRHWIEGCLRHGARLYVGKLDEEALRCVDELERYLIHTHGEGVPRLVEGGGGGRCTCYATFSCGVADFFARPKGAARVHRSW